MPEAAPPLAGVKVVDISNFLAGPVSTMFLADFGAEVVKIERPDTGDELRFWGNDKDGVGLMFKLVNRNKRSVTADLRTPLGVEIVKRLVADADIVVENYRKGTLERWGLGLRRAERDQSRPHHGAPDRLRADRPQQPPAGLRHARRGLFGLCLHHRLCRTGRRCCPASASPTRARA